jgi:hypothetical protein
MPVGTEENQNTYVRIADSRLLIEPGLPRHNADVHINSATTFSPMAFYFSSSIRQNCI